MELINEVPPIKVEGRIAACEGGNLNNILYPPFFLQVLVSCLGIILLPVRINLAESTLFVLLKQTQLLLDIQLSIYALICPSQLYASTVVCALFKIITIRAAL